MSPRGALRLNKGPELVGRRRIDVDPGADRPDEGLVFRRPNDSHRQAIDHAEAGGPPVAVVRLTRSSEEFPEREPHALTAVPANLYPQEFLVDIEDRSHLLSADQEVASQWLESEGLRIARLRNADVGCVGPAYLLQVRRVVHVKAAGVVAILRLAVRASVEPEAVWILDTHLAEFLQQQNEHAWFEDHVVIEHDAVGRLAFERRAICCLQWPDVADHLDWVNQILRFEARERFSRVYAVGSDEVRRQLMHVCLKGSALHSWHMNLLAGPRLRTTPAFERGHEHYQI